MAATLICGTATTAQWYDTFTLPEDATIITPDGTDNLF